MNSHLRVLMVMDGLLIGGTETHVLSLITGLQGLGEKLFYVGASGPLYDSFSRTGCQIHLVNLTPGYLLQESKRQYAIHDLKQIMLAKKINVVHIHQIPSGIYAAIAAKELGIPVVFTVHGTYYPADQLFQAFKLSNAVVSVSKPVQTLLKSLDYPSNLIPNAINLDEFYPTDSQYLRQILGIASDSRVVVYASRLSWEKSSICELLIKAAHRVRLEKFADLHVVVVGDGAQFSSIQQLSKSIHRSLGETFIHLVGNQKLLRNYLGLGDLVVGTGRVALESMACGKPVLAIGTRGFFGMVTPSLYPSAWDYYFGDHFADQTPTEDLIAESLLLALLDREALKVIGRQGREWVMDNFNIHKISRQIAEIYSNVQHSNQMNRGIV
ncbi:glycosyltransferase (plasmid) [Alicyclobacillus fastidiosus]|uniref:Glycosyltransferase n=2 Tax=Alicyclobacillus fastidiosus TaxID=392011 RepID=A0ABY6ZSD7_9BACL|nr:glycosyltransferase [Alicyclobacillus fastidiosus]WAH45026.1 glycosyltransferase [Alicyclobacillus fastidiosus]GMA66229.1 hypothetical protein GCM10025859_66710 [Alicyclobacillus fastidiosus]